MPVTRLWSGRRHASKVELICFDDTLTMATSVNIKPALFSPSRRRRDPSRRPFVRGECVIACSEVLMLAGVLEEESWTRSSQTDASFFRLQSGFPSEMHAGQRSCSPASELVAVHWAARLVQQAVRAHSVVRVHSDVWPGPHFPPQQQSTSLSEPCKCWSKMLAGNYFPPQILCLWVFFEGPCWRSCDVSLLWN